MPGFCTLKPMKIPIVASPFVLRALSTAVDVPIAVVSGIISGSKGENCCRYAVASARSLRRTVRTTLVLLQFQPVMSRSSVTIRSVEYVQPDLAVGHRLDGLDRLVVAVAAR